MISKLAVFGAFSAVNAGLCVDPGQTENGWRIDMEQFPDGSIKEVFYKCQPGYEVQGYMRDTIELKCTEAGEWDYTPPSLNPNFCVQVETMTVSDGITNVVEETTMAMPCEAVDEIENATRFVTSFDHGGEVVFSCNPGYCAEGARSRSVLLQCRHGSWNQRVPTCSPCEMCATPTDGDEKKAHYTVSDDYTMTVTCFEGYVIKPGTEQYDVEIDCIEGQEWAMPIPQCTRPSEVNCGESEITINIDGNVMKAFGWAGDENNLIMYGVDIDQEPPEGCQATLVSGSEGSTFTWSLATPFSDTCRTSLEMVNDNYVFSNKIVWNYSRSAIKQSAVLLDFECVYEGMFVSHLNNPIKLAIATKTYTVNAIEARSLGGVPAGTAFTGSMAIYSNNNFTNLIDNVPILHRGKRYYVEMSLHERELGTPFLQNCYGSSSFRSESELQQLYMNPSNPDQVKPMIQGGCPKPNSLIRLEYSPNHHSRRFSFLFPKLNVGIAELKYLYIHCEIALVRYGSRPSCSTLNTEAINARNGGRVVGRNGLKFNTILDLNEKQSVEEGNDIIDQLEEYTKLRENGAHSNTANDEFATDDMFGVFGNMNSNDNAEEVTFDRKKRSIKDDHAFSFGPVVFPPKEDEEVLDMNLILPDEIIYHPKPQKSDDTVLVEEIEEVEEILEDTLEDELNKMVDEEQQKRMVVIICVIVGGIFVFIVATLIGINVNIATCMGGDDSDSTKEVVKRPKKSNFNAHVIPDSSCATSQQSVSMS